MSIDDMDKFEQTEMMKKRSLTKNTWNNWHNCLINCIPEPIKKRDGVKGKIMSVFKVNITQDYSKPTRVRNMYCS